MSLQEIDFNIIVLFYFSFLNIDKRKRDEFNLDKNKNNKNVFDALRSSVIIL